MKTKILIAGQGRHGKDELCSILNKKYGLTYTSSSWMAAEKFIYDKMKDTHGYSSVEECFNDRHTDDNRALWYQYITEYNKDDPARLAKQIVAENDIYCGLRSKRELDECYRQGVFHLTFWVDASERVEFVEGSDSISIGPEDCHFTLFNNTDLAHLEREADFVWEQVEFMEAQLTWLNESK